MSRREFFDQLHADFKQEPPQVDRIRKCIEDLVDALCKFVPNRPDLHAKIRADILVEDVSATTMYQIVSGLVKWIKQFQAPYLDATTDQWLTDFGKAIDYAQFLRDFLEAYYDHLEMVYDEVNSARHRVVNGESAVPPQHRPKHTNGVPHIMRSGLR